MRRKERAMSTTAIAAIIVILIIIGVVAAYFATKSGGPATTTQTSTTSPIGTQTTTSTAQAKFKDTLVIGVTDKVTDLDPSNAYDFYTWEVLYNVMSGLVKYKPGTSQIIPDLATNWTVSQGGKVWTFNLRHDAKFADGTPCTAQDVVRSIKRVMTIQGDPSWLVTSFVQDVKALNDYTVQFTLKKPVSYFLALLATPPYYPVSPQYPNDKIVSDATWGGCGPYMIQSWERDVQLVLKANPYYYGPKPKTETIVIKFYSDANSLELALRNHEIDIAWRTLNPEQIQNFKKDQNFKVIEVPGSFIRYVVVNTKMNPTDNVLVREALAAAINRTDIANTVFLGMVDPLYSMVPMGLWSHIDIFKDKYGDNNIQLAKQLLTKAGYSEQNKLDITLWYTPTHYGDTEADLAQVLASQWEATGMIKVNIKSAEWSQYVSQLRNGTQMVSLLGWYPDYIDPDDYLTPFLHTVDNKWTGTGYSNPQVDKLLDQASVLTDLNQRTQLYDQVQQILANDAPFIPLIQGKLFMVTTPNVGGITLGPTMLLPYYLLYATAG
ncbi:MAG: ABC transporter substrate-binding protein [Desulfurococcales archaeon]|nr:ABC transporter substrate-binding protein [Desulfurococcales archaeon]